MKKDWTNKKDFIEEVINSVERIAEKEPYIAINILCMIIELFGKLISNHEIDKVGTSQADFEFAINELEAFKKYRNVPFNFYKQVRCSLVHILLPNDSISFSPTQNNLNKSTIGCKELLADITSAWKEVQENENAKKLLKKKGAIIDSGFTGGTKSHMAILKNDM